MFNAKVIAFYLLRMTIVIVTFVHVAKVLVAFFAIFATFHRTLMIFAIA
jgi:hypothetical protein